LKLESARIPASLPAIEELERVREKEPSPRLLQTCGESAKVWKTDVPDGFRFTVVTIPSKSRNVENSCCGKSQGHRGFPGCGNRMGSDCATQQEQLFEADWIFSMNLIFSHRQGWWPQWPCIAGKGMLSFATGTAIR
jgi:hypothetical protein